MFVELGAFSVRQHHGQLYHQFVVNELNRAGVSGHALPVRGRRTRVRIVPDPAAVTKPGVSRSEWNLAPQRAIVP
jgi:hypothetical protein